MNRLPIAAAILYAGLSSVASGDSALSEVNKLRLISSYQQAVIAQQAVTQAQARLQDAIRHYNETEAKVKADAKLPDAAKITVDLDKQEVTVALPETKK